MNSRYYSHEWSRFINADDTDGLTATLNDLTDKNLFIYCDNNPITRTDSNGYFWETFFDVVSMGQSAYNLVSKPSWGNAGYLAWDIGATALPFVPGSYTAKALKSASKIGRKGKQTRLRKLASSDKVSTALRGEIKRDINQIKKERELQ